jgi:hypothetical protein
MTGVLGSIYGRKTAGETVSNVGHFETAQSLVTGQSGCYPSES